MATDVLHFNFERLQVTGTKKKDDERCNGEKCGKKLKEVTYTCVSACACLQNFRNINKTLLINEVSYPIFLYLK